MEDTIVAVSTAMANGAISIIRLSGEDSINIVNSIFKIFNSIRSIHQFKNGIIA